MMQKKMLLHRIVRKLGLSGVLYRIMSRFCSRGVDVSVCSVKEAEQRLLAMYPDNGESSICRNNFDKPLQYDLQIVIPAYNVESYIEECMNSVLSQKTGYSFVVTVVNDGSTDRTSDLLHKYDEYPNVVIFEQKNHGFSGARNTALDNIKGRYIAFLDADDRMPAGAVESLLRRAFETHADIVEGGYRCFTSKAVVSEFRHKVILTKDWSVLYGFSVGKVYHSSLFMNVHFPPGYWFEDTVCTYMLYPQSKSVATVDDIVYEYRINEMGITVSSKGNIRILEALWVTMRMLDDAKRNAVVFDDILYEGFLNDLRINYTRFVTLKSDALHRDAFIVSCALKRRFFDTCSTEKSYLKPLDRVLNECDYGNYLLYGRCYLCE